MIPANTMLVDTNVWLDYFLGDRANHASSKEFILQARITETPLVITPHSLCDVFYIVQAQLKLKNRVDGKLAPEEAASSARDVAWTIVDCILNIATVGPADQMDAYFAAKNRMQHCDFEDNMVIACAKRTGARMLVTNDQDLIRHVNTMVAMTAKDAAALLADH